MRPCGPEAEEGTAEVEGLEGAPVLGLSASRGQSVNAPVVANAPLGQMAQGTAWALPPAPGC